MKRAVSLIAAAMSCVATHFVHAGTLTFEDLTPPAMTGYDVMPAPYAGLVFTGWYYGYDSIYSPASGVIDLFTDYAYPQNPGAYLITGNNAITATAPFHFDGASFSGYSGVTFELYRNGELVHTSATLPDAPGAAPYEPTFLASGYAGEVDKVVVVGVQGYYSMDNLSVTISAIPEPSSWVLFLGAFSVGLPLFRSLKVR